ncbi:hypothetical protein RM572_06395 [Streptomyces sp. DSM 42041]|uniref:Uncharacterized protein n=1 Tax=Streptomyces hazeniae TaxID=3075538 RepID=A0ABU2NN66_9ACTN|nr:hypothetical protein [Streptomyces sp. DSM 42041]MDT0378410.1 hypothetical protein [Streptomyces sp. DSM 42041]
MHHDDLPRLATRLGLHLRACAVEIETPDDGGTTTISIRHLRRQHVLELIQSEPATPAAADEDRDVPDLADALRNSLVAAGLSNVAVEHHDFAGETKLQLLNIDRADADALIRLLQRPLEPARRAADAWNAAIAKHGLDDLRTPRVGRQEFTRVPVVDLGEASINTADRLARLLGARDGAHPLDPAPDHTADWPEIEETTERLCAASRQTLGVVFVDVYAHPYCQRCGGLPAIRLGELPVEELKRLADHLHNAPLPSSIDT